MSFRPNDIFPPMILLIVYLLSCQDTVVAAHTKLKELPSQRSRRQARAPLQVDCELGQWSEWTECLPCQGKRYRYRALLHPAQYGGRSCTGSLWEEEPCHPTGTCVQSQDCGTNFQCKASGRCLKQHLVCNGEPDCRDKSDEAGCQHVEKFCDDELHSVPGISEAARGFNILTKEQVQLVYDPAYYGGQCEWVYNGEWRKIKYDVTCERLYHGEDEKYFRKPYNVHFYQFLAHADSGFSSEFYADATDLLDALKTDSSDITSVTLGIGPPSVPGSLDLGFRLALGVGNLQNITQYAAKNVGFIRTLTKVQTARFKMRREDIFLDENMLQFLMDLPDQYNYGLYAKFINLYGTHFMTSGTMGGIFEYIIVIDQDEMRREEITSSMISACIGSSIGVSFSLPMDILTDGEQESRIFCAKVISPRQDASQANSVVLNIIPRIRGGNSESVRKLLGSWHATAYSYWGRSLKLNPAVIDFENGGLDCKVDLVDARSGLGFEFRVPFQKCLQPPTDAPQCF